MVGADCCGNNCLVRADMRGAPDFFFIVLVLSEMSGVSEATLLLSIVLY